MANNVETFDLEGWIKAEICCWPGCNDKALQWVVRLYDEKRICHCPRHHIEVANKPQCRTEFAAVRQVDPALEWERINV